MAAATTAFTTVRSEGGLLPPDLLARIVAGDSDLGGLGPTDYGFAHTERLGEAISRSWNRAKTYWEAFKADREALGESDTGLTETRDWVFRLLRELGWERPEFRAAGEELNGRRYPIQHRSGPVPLHVISAQLDLDKAVSAGAGQPRVTPHGLVQEYLNASEDSRYGVVSNGLGLRLLRHNLSLTRLAALEFDLQAMFEGSVYADFVLLFLTLHRSRLPQPDQDPSTCWLERWRDKAESQGTRALGALRVGVENAITALGNGLLAHEANELLREQLRSGELSTVDFYAELLRLVYRLIFLFVAEERDLLYTDGADPAMKERYRRDYSASRLRDVARRYRTDERHEDLWRTLQVTFGLLADDRQGLGIEPVGGLFAKDTCPHIDAARIRNSALAEAITWLSLVRVDKRVRRVNYHDMDTEELGGVYESLLERQPRVNVDGSIGSRFDLVGSGERKSSGSYYTPSTLVQEVIKSALEPVIADRLAQAGGSPEARERALLGITVCDPACGSGHFLLAGARRIATELARVRTADREPGRHEMHLALRDVVRHCIYGVDLNPLAVDLCRLGLWLETQEGGLALSFLDHHVKLGNSLVGATPDLILSGLPDGAFEPTTGDDKTTATAVKRRNKQERAGQKRLLGGSVAEWGQVQTRLSHAVGAIAALPETSVRAVADLRVRYSTYQQDQMEPARAALDAWTSAFFWPLRPDAPVPPPTSADLLAKPGSRPRLSDNQWLMVGSLRSRFHFFHWTLEFPEVFERGGFDAVVGNPPWERIKLQEQEFFAERDPEIARAPNKAARQKLIDTLPQRDPSLAHSFIEAKRGDIPRSCGLAGV